MSEDEPGCASASASAAAGCTAASGGAAVDSSGAVDSGTVVDSAAVDDSAANVHRISVRVASWSGWVQAMFQTNELLRSWSRLGHCTYCIVQCPSREDEFLIKFRDEVGQGSIYMYRSAEGLYGEHEDGRAWPTVTEFLANDKTFPGLHPERFKLVNFCIKLRWSLPPRLFRRQPDRVGAPPARLCTT